MTERFDPYRKMDLDDPNRPIKIDSTVEAIVPPASRRFLDHKVDAVTFPNGNKGFHHRITLPEGVMVAHVDPAERLALVKNYRHPIGRYSVEIPSGGAEPHEKAALDAATDEEKEIILKTIGAREAEEEIGWRLTPDELHRMFKGPLQGSVGFADQTYHIFHGEGGVPAIQNHDDGEAGMLTILRHPLDEAVEMLGHEIVDPASTAAILGLARMYDKRSDNIKSYHRHTHNS